MTDNAASNEPTLDEDEEEEKPDPAIKAPDLYAAAKDNDTELALSLLNEGVPPFYFDKKNKWTVCQISYQ